jgi:hypothetical protein
MPDIARLAQLHLGIDQGGLQTDGLPVHAERGCQIRKRALPERILVLMHHAEASTDPRLRRLVAEAQRAGNGAALTLNRLTLTEQALELGIALGDRHREAALRNNLADLLHAAGRREEAMAQLKQAVVIFAEIGAGAGDSQPEIWKLTEW